MNDLSTSSDFINNKIQSHYKILIDNVNNTNQAGLIDISQSYNTNDNEVNFNHKEYSNKQFVNDNKSLLSSNKFQTEKSVTDNNIYKTKDFWTNQVPDIKTNEYLVRDIPRYFYDKSVERYIQPKDTYGNYFKGDIIINESEPKVSKNYMTNYTSVDGKTIHEGNKKGNMNGKYKKNENYSNNLNEGMIVYYDDNLGQYYGNEFNIEQDKKQLKDPNGNNYNKFMNKNVAQENLTEHEKNIMLRRNDNILASMNYTMRYDN